MSAGDALLWDGEEMVGPYGPLNAEQVADAIADIARAVCHV